MQVSMRHAPGNRARMMTSSAHSTKVRADPSWLWKERQPLLGRVDFELTERCNNNCIHCYINLPTGDLGAKHRELPTRDLQHILVEAASLGCLDVRFTGGEPLLRDDFEELYLFARHQGLKVLLFTNATLITGGLTVNGYERGFDETPQNDKSAALLTGCRLCLTNLFPLSKIASDST